MTRFSAMMRSAAASAAILAAQPALADVTSQQVWDDLEAYMSSFGYEVTGTETLSGDTLTVSDMGLSIKMPEGEGTLRFSAAEVRLEDLGDGRVRLTFPPSMAISLSMTEVPDGEPFDLTLDYSQQNLEMIVSGAPGDMTYDHTADSLGMRLASLVVDGETMGPDVARVDIGLTGIAGTSKIAAAELRNISQTMSIGGMTYDMAFNDPEGSGGFLLAGGVTGLEFSGTTAVPMQMNPEKMQEMLAAGFAVDAEFSHSGGSTDFSATEDGMTTAGRTSTEAGSFMMKMNADTISYDAGARGVSFAMSGGELPFPVEASMAETSFNMTMPISSGEEVRDVAAGLTLGGFTMSDMLWNVFDPGKVLPRDPATVAFALNGKVKMLVDLMDPAQMAAVDSGEMMPAEPQSVTLSDLRIDAIGAQVTGNGAFTFDNSDLQTFDGLPRPTGVLNLTINGANGVIDKLIRMGLMQEEDAMGARMMLSMFAVPAGGEDQLKSTIEINEQGHVLANGQRIQ